MSYNLELLFCDCKKLLIKAKNDLIFILQWIIKKHPRKKDYFLGNNIYLYYWKIGYNTDNLGDYLSKIVVTHFIPKNTPRHNRNHAKKTLYAIGSIIGLRCQDATIWGSGILSAHKKRKRQVIGSTFDIRAVRGPKTREVLLQWGKECPEIYGDPAILMPIIFTPQNTSKKYKVSLVLHHEYNNYTIPENADIHKISILTTDYKDFITQIVQSQLVISSSLHGIIIAETYGVPAILLLNEDTTVFKYEDWYNSTGRYNIIAANSITEALTLSPMDLPDLTEMQKQLLQSFPYDLWAN